MGIELLEIGDKLMKIVMFTVRGCFRSVWNHPFLVGMVCFLIFLYRLSPFMFSLLVSASPVLVCTAVLLGTLLSFGHPNIPEIDVEEKTTHEVVSLKTGVVGDATVVEKNESYYVERYSEKSRDDDEVDEVRRQDCSDDTAPLIEDRSREREFDDDETWEANGELGDLRWKQKDGQNEERHNEGEIMDNHYVSVAKTNDEVLGSDDENSDADSFDSETVNVDSLDSPPRSPWTRIEERDDEEKKDEQEDEEDNDEDEDDDLDSGSDRAESSSPDASMADILPMLDELHPLLDEEAPQPVHFSRGDSDAVSRKSQKSSASDHEADDDTENQEDSEIADDDNEDGEDEEDAKGDKEEETKSAISWTEEDQKNLMDLGSSEIERNQRLESLILRRRARKNMGLFPERNLIDLDIVDRPFNIAPISTRRQNPFDLPNDSHDDSGLPPIPGSAPSILLTRRNPFDIPYDSGEEKPDLMADGFKDEFSTLQSREPFFRRHESFNVRSSLFAPGRQAVKMRPYFVPEGLVSEESSYSPFQRQLSGLSDFSKASSVPETDSIGSVEDVEERKLPEEDNQAEVEGVAWTKEVTEEGPSEDPELISKQEEVTEEDLHQEQEPISKMESVTELIRHGSESSLSSSSSSSSSSEHSLELGQVEKGEVQVGGLEFQLRDNADRIQEGSITETLEVHSYNSNTEAVEQRYNRVSSSLSLSVSERVFTETEGEEFLVLEGRQDVVADEPVISTQTSVESTDLSTTGTLEGDGLLTLEGRQDSVVDKAVISPQSSIESTGHREPVYDSSPRGLGKNLSSSSISSDIYQDSAPGLTHVLVRTTASEGISQEIKTNITSNIEMLPESSTAHLVDESRPINVVGIREHDDINGDFLDQNSESEGSSAAMKLSGKALVEENPIEPHILSEVTSSSADKNTVESSEDQKLDRSLEKNVLISEEESVSEVIKPPFEGQPKAEDSISMEETVESPNPNAGVYDKADENLVFTSSAEGSTSLFYDKAITEPVFKHIDVQASSISVEASEDVPSEHKSGVPKIQELDQDSSSKVNSPLSSDFISTQSSVSEKTSSLHMPTIVEEADEIREIDEGILSELDNIGDFSIKQWESGSSVYEKHIDSIGESFSSAYHTETSTTSVFEVKSVEENKIEDGKHSENSREDMEHIGQDSPDWEASQEDKTSKENEVLPAHSVVNHNYEDNNAFGTPEVEVPLVGDVDSVSNKAESTSVEMSSNQGQVDEDTTYGMPELEASTIEDINLAFKQISAKEIEKPIILEPPHAEPVVGETITEHSVEMVSNHGHVDTDTTYGMPELEARTIEDIDLALKQISAKEIERHGILEPPHAELVVGETIIEHFVEMASNQGHVDTDTTCGMPELKASTIEDIDLVFKKISAKEIEKPVVLEPPHPELVVGETITEHSEDEILHTNSNVPNSAHDTSVLEVRAIEDATSDFKQSSDDSRESPMLPDLVDSAETRGTSSELHVAKPPPPEGTTLPAEAKRKLDSDDESVDKVGLSMEESSVKEVSAFAAEKSNDEVEAHSTTSTKNKIARSSS